MELNGQFRAPAAPCTHWTGGCVAQEPVWMRWRRENSQPLPRLEAPIIQPVAQRYTTELSRLLWWFTDVKLPVGDVSWMNGPRKKITICKFWNYIFGRFNYTVVKDSMYMFTHVSECISLLCIVCLAGHVIHPSDIQVKMPGAEHRHRHTRTHTYNVCVYIRKQKVDKNKGDSPLKENSGN
jgi:hypothetical protein